MRIMVGNKAVNIRKSGNTLWYPRREAAVIQKMDSMFERTSPTELAWDADKPKGDVEAEINPETPQVEPFRPPVEETEEVVEEEPKKLDFDLEEEE